jgi:DNA-binding SARP family transcriptional activator
VSVAEPGRFVTVRVLGPVDVAVDGSPIAIPAPELAVVVVLAFADGHPVTVANLVDALWGEAPPPGAAASLPDLVASLRRALAAGGADPTAVRAEAGGYRLASAAEPDFAAFDRLVADARTGAADGRLEASAGSYRAALGLWRGAALADLTAAFAELEAERLEELRLCVLEERLELDLKLARHVQVLDELTELVTDHPLREHFRAQLMLALYRCDRAEDALAAYREAEDYLQEPGLRLRQMHLAVLSGHPSLQPPRDGSRVRNRVPPNRQPDSRECGSEPGGAGPSSE